MTGRKGRFQKRDLKDLQDPLLNQLFNSHDTNDKQKDTRPDRSIDPNEELEALLLGVKNKGHKHDQNLNTQNIPPEKRSTVPDPNSNTDSGNADELMTLNYRGAIPQPQPSMNLMASVLPNGNIQPPAQNAPFAGSSPSVQTFPGISQSAANPLPYQNQPQIMLQNNTLSGRYTLVLKLWPYNRLRIRVNMFNTVDSNYCIPMTFLFLLLAEITIISINNVKDSLTCSLRPQTHGA